MIDPFTFLALVLLLPVVALFAFVGCENASGPGAPSAPIYRTNCGGPPQVDGVLGWEDDSDPNAASVPNKGFILTNSGSPVIDPANKRPAGTIYETCRFGNPGMSYQYPVGQGNFRVILKFAQFPSNPNLQGPFAFAIDGGGNQPTEEKNFDVAAPNRAGAPLTKYDYTADNVAVTAAGLLTITFSQALNQVSFPFVNAIEIDLYVQ